MLPPPEPVRFDDSAANDAIRHLSMTGESLGEVLGSIETSVPITTDGWTGTTRYVFDSETARLDLLARALMAEAHEMAVRVAQGQYEAHAEHQRRWAQYRLDAEAAAQARRAALQAGEL